MTRGNGAVPWPVIILGILFVLAFTGNISFWAIFIAVFFVLPWLQNRERQEGIRRPQGQQQGLPPPQQQQGLPPQESQPPPLPRTDRSTGGPVDDRAGESMPRIDIPEYPQGAGDSGSPGGAGTTGATAYSSPPPSTPSSAGPVDPVVSMAQIELSRLAADLDRAARAGDTAGAQRIVAALGEQSRRTRSGLRANSGASADTRAFQNGLRHLDRLTTAAGREDPPGPRIAQVVRAARQLGQTGSS